MPKPFVTRHRGTVRYEFEGSAPVPIALAIHAGDFVFVSGLSDHYFDPAKVKFDANGEVLDDGSGAGHASIEEQTRGTLRNIQVQLKRAGCTLDDVVQMIVWLKDPRDFVGFNNAFKEFFIKVRPVRAVLRNAFLFTTKIEIMCTAYKPRGGTKPAQLRPRKKLAPRPKSRRTARRR